MALPYGTHGEYYVLYAICLTISWKRSVIDASTSLTDLGSGDGLVAGIDCGIFRLTPDITAEAGEYTQAFVMYVARLQPPHKSHQKRIFRYDKYNRRYGFQPYKKHGFKLLTFA